MTIKHVDIVVVGAGLIGSALALLMSKRAKGNAKPLSIALVERGVPLDASPNRVSNQRVVALGHTAQTVLSEIGVFEQLGSAFANPYQRMSVWDENSSGLLEFDASEHDLALLGHMVDSVQCTQLLQQEIERTPEISTYYTAQPEAIKRLEPLSAGESSVQLLLRYEGCDQILQAPLIVAADGAKSWVRQEAKIFANHHRYQQHGIVAKVETQEQHQNTAWQRFLSAGPLAFLPVEDNQCSIVWTVDSSDGHELMALDKSDFENRLTLALGRKLGQVSLITKPIAFELMSQQAQHYFTHNIVLAGDAAHSIHPLAGQGANLGFKDIDALTRILCDEQVGALSNIRLLQAYQRERKPDNQQTDLMMSALHNVYQQEMPIWLGLRGVGMNLVDRSSTIKAWLVKQAVGS